MFFFSLHTEKHEVTQSMLCFSLKEDGQSSFILFSCLTIILIFASYETLMSPTSKNCLNDKKINTSLMEETK